VRVLVAAFSLFALVAASVAAAADSRGERIELRPADVALAKRIALRPGDLSGSWRRLSIPDTGDDGQMTCPGFNPDLSRFTITGKAINAYFRPSGASVMSAIEVYRSRADAVGDFIVATNPAVVRCLREEIQRGTSGVARVSVARIAAPRVGERRTAFRVIARISAGAQSVALYMDAVIVQRGRSIAVLFFTSPNRPLGGQARVAAAVAARMR
jgi:hypothetical protein